MRRKQGAFAAAQILVTVAVLLLVSLPISNQPGSQSSTSTLDQNIDTTTAPCNAPGVFCGPGFAISNASLLSASTLGGNYSLLNFTVHGTYANLHIATMSVWLTDANFSQYTTPGVNGGHHVGTISPTWSGKDGGSYAFDVPMTGFDAVRGARCGLWIDAYLASGPGKGDNWAEQNITIA